MKNRKKNKDRLTPEDIGKFKALLLAKRNEILGNVRSMEDEALRRERSDLSSMPTHMANAGTDNYDVENTLGLMESERKILIEIDDALRRIEDGTYGFCEGGGEPISKERLEAIPWTKYCVACANLLEKGLIAEHGFFSETKHEDKPQQKQYKHFKTPPEDKKP